MLKKKTLLNSTQRVKCDEETSRPSACSIVKMHYSYSSSIMFVCSGRCSQKSLQRGSEDAQTNSAGSFDYSSKIPSKWDLRHKSSTRVRDENSLLEESLAADSWGSIVLGLNRCWTVCRVVTAGSWNIHHDTTRIIPVALEQLRLGCFMVFCLYQITHAGQREELCGIKNLSVNTFT